jgi:hypothetical protein
MMRGQSTRSVPRRAGTLSHKDAGATQSTLYDDVQKAFERACSESDFEVAEYLLRTLESIARREANDSSLDRAYLILAHCMGRG